MHVSTVCPQCDDRAIGRGTAPIFTSVLRWYAKDTRGARGAPDARSLHVELHRGRAVERQGCHSHLFTCTADGLSLDSLSARTTSGGMLMARSTTKTTHNLLTMPKPAAATTRSRPPATADIAARAFEFYCKRGGHDDTTSRIGCRQSASSKRRRRRGSPPPRNPRSLRPRPRQASQMLFADRIWLSRLVTGFSDLAPTTGKPEKSSCARSRENLPIAMSLQRR